MNQFETYSDTFIRNRKPHIRRSLKGQWQTVPYVLDDRAVQRHLQGQHWVGTRAFTHPPRTRVAASYTRYSVIDVDNHTASMEGPTDAYWQAVDGVVELFPGACHIRSSDSNGQHVLLQWRRDLSIRRVNTYIKNRLARKALEHLEVYPCDRGIRLPFGAESYVITPELLPLTSSWQESVEYVSALERLAVRDIFQRKDMDIKAHQARRRHAHSVALKNGTWKQRVLGYMRDGMQQDGDRHPMSYEISKFLKAKDWSNTQIQEYLLSWCMDKHNGHSALVHNRKELIRTIHQIVNHTPDIRKSLPPEVREKLNESLDVELEQLICNEVTLILSMCSNK